MKTNFEALYRRIGLLFYAAALRQRPLTIAEYDRLNAIVNQRWRVGENREARALDHELSANILKAVREAFRQSMSVGEAMQLFTIFYQLHSLAFDNTLIDKIVSTYRQITDEFSTTHEKQAKEVTKLQEMFGRTKTNPAEMKRL